MAKNNNNSNKYRVSYYDNHSNLRQRYVTSQSERDALVDSWLNDKNVVMPICAERV
jgi:hypothetical protein